MNGPHTLSPRRSVLPAALLVCVCLLLAGANAARAEEPAITYTHESVQAYEGQLAHGEIVSATFNKRVRNLHLTLKNGQHALVHYPPKDEPTLDAQLKAKNVPVTVLSPSAAKSEAAKTPVKHKLRYIAGGIVIAIIVIVAIVLLLDRRRKRLAE